jgi:ribose transport system ATP-binding protein
MNPVIEVRNLEKSFGGVPVLRDVSLHVNAGEVVALAGENGAGKSTVMKIVTGQIQRDAGDVLIEGQSVPHIDTQLARSLGVAIVPQELAPYPDLTVYENLFVGREMRTRFGLLDRRGMLAQARKMLDVFEVDIDPSTLMNRLSVSVTQLVEIAKATTWGAKAILLDEPTSAIPDREVDRLYAVVRKLQSQGVAMIYTTHRMAEIQQLADRVVVLRDGRLVMDQPLAQATEHAIVRAMIGRDLDSLFPDKVEPRSEIGLMVRDLQVERGGPTVSLEVRRGEILGLGGLVGAGRTEIAEAIFGIRESHEGNILVGDVQVRRNSPSAAISAGVALVPEDRKGAGLVLLQSVLDNTSLPHISAFATGGWIHRRERRAAVKQATESVSLRGRGLDQLVGTLSGGNQQKVVIARWLTEEANVLLLDEPTRGVDVGARGEIYAIIHDLASTGLAVLLVSSDMQELIGLSNRVMVVRGGAVVGELSSDDLGRDDVQERIFRFASGLEQNESEGNAA